MTTFSRFHSYDHAELAAAGEAFLAAVGAEKIDAASGTAAWTDFVLDWFADKASPDVQVDAKPAGNGARRKTFGEFLVDLCHSTYPRYSDTPYDASYFRKAVEGKCRIRLALESEWGKSRSARERERMTLEDAAKLASLRADVKVMVYASGGPDESKATEELLSRLRVAAGDEAPWLVIDVPWEWSKGNQPRATVFR